MWPFNRKPEDSSSGSDDVEDSIRCATASIVAERKFGDEGEIRCGTKHFRGAAKVYIIDSYPGMCESAVVIGHHRKSGRYIKLSMKVKHLTNFRITSVYSPKVIRMQTEHFREQGRTTGVEGSIGVCPEHLLESVKKWAETESEQAVPPKSDRAGG